MLFALARASVALPILKWAGGKRALLPELLARVPTEIGTYYEPFAGGAALFFRLADAPPFERAVLADRNAELINFYAVVRDRLPALSKVLEQAPQGEEMYYAVRDVDVSALDDVARAARVVYLNRTCFNGLWRENRSGKFNVPYGHKVRARLCDPARMKRATEALANVQLLTGDFAQVVSKAKAGDFVYFDPPYAPVSATSKFTDYSGGGFDMDAQERLCQVATQLRGRGVRVMLSNSDTRDIRVLYKDFKLSTVDAPRAISARNVGRGVVRELLIEGSVG